MENRYKVTLDFKQRSIFNMNFVQNNVDTAAIEFTIVDGGQVVPITGQAISIAFLKQDKTLVIQDISSGVSILEGGITGKLEVILKSNTLASAGIVKGEISFSLAGKKLSTAAFIFTVSGSLDNGEGLLSTNEIPLLDAKIAEIEVIKAEYVASDLGSLNTRIDSVDAQLADYATLVTNHIIHTTDDPQTIFNSGAAGDKFTFAKGIHSHPPVNSGAILYLDKSCVVELAPGAVLTIPNNVVAFNPTAEIIKNFSTVNINLDDLSVGGVYDLTVGAAYAVQIDSVGGVDTFKWSPAFSGSPIWSATNVPITGGYQALDHGITIKFNSVTGHNLDSLWLVCYGVNPYYGIRSGLGFQTDYIDGISIIGEGVIDLNQQNQYSSNAYTKFLSAGVQICGRVKNISIDKITITNAPRPVQMYGENTGTYNLDGTVTGGVSYDVMNIRQTRTKAINCISANLYGFPEHRGAVKNLYFAENSCEGTEGLIECNHGLDTYLVVNNKYTSYNGKNMLLLWRHSKNGSLHGNQMSDTSGVARAISVASPPTWQFPENISYSDNTSNYANTNGTYSLAFGDESNQAPDNASVALGGLNNKANGKYGFITGNNGTISGDYNAIMGGTNNIIRTATNTAIIEGTGNLIDSASNAVILCGNNCKIVHPYSVLQGADGVSDFNMERGIGLGMFAAQGDAKVTTVGCKGLSTTDTYVQITANGVKLTIPPKCSAAYSVIVIGKSTDSTQHGMWKAEGIWTRDASSVYSLIGNTVTKTYATNANWDFTIDVIADCLNLKAKGDVSQEVRWVATVNLSIIKC